MDVPRLDRTRPCTGKVNFPEFDEVRISRLQHVHDLSTLIDDLP
jgi:hypothetical protein